MACPKCVFAVVSDNLHCVVVAAPQIVIQLRKFAEAVRRIKGAVGTADKPAAAPSGRPGAAAGGASEGGGYLGRDMSSMLRTEMTGIDPSLGGM